VATELVGIGDVFVTADKASLQQRYQDIRDVYLSDSRPWVVGYSGGKDSTTALQMIWMALRGLEPDQLKKPVYILSSDTLVETPKIVEYIDTNLELINRAATAQGLPISAHKVQPLITDSFWVNLIGRGYPAPSTQFRWCTERLKIDPANRFILDRVAEFGEVVMILGVRRDESSTRAQVMNLHRIEGSSLSRHSTLPNAFVYTPIEDFTVKDVWTFLLQVGSPWGGNNRDLVTLYRNAQAGECPLVVDKHTSSCGNSRFGCWVCTRLGRSTAEYAMHEERSRVISLELEEMQRKLDRQTDEVASRAKGALNLRRASTIHLVLDEYRTVLMRKKVEQLERAISDCFNVLSRKKDTLRTLKIDAADFSVQLMDRNQRPLKKSELSAGEKQIFAVAVLWGLAKVSGKPLPMIVDTPLARLDSDHRRLLAENYFPHAGHQVIVLSTDTEIDRKYFDLMQDHVSHSYTLEYSSQVNGTVVKEGYFGNEVN
jgi:putative sulfurtransferase DndC